MTSISETLFDTYGDSLMQEYAPYDEAEILAALDRGRFFPFHLSVSFWTTVSPAD